jgi:hypothetical protein
MEVAFLFIAEAYQCYHGAAIAIRLAAQPGVRVTAYINDPETPAHLDRITQAYGSPPLDIRRLPRSWPTRLLQGVRVLGMMKTPVMWENRRTLDAYDAIVTVEDTVAFARRVGIRRPKLIYAPHGAGDREVGFTRRLKAFDYVLLSGKKSVQRMLAAGLVQPDGYALIGSIKLETTDRLRGAPPKLFANDRPIVLYNPHKAPGLSSWARFIEPMLEQFSRQKNFNLLVAPHVKLFRRRNCRVRDAWEARGTETILIDTGSLRSVDTTYTQAADIYVGDVSSQVYEFLTTPRPCVFLDVTKNAWQNDPNFAHWQFGDVVSDPTQLLPAIEAAPARHGLYRARQEAMVQASLGPQDGQASVRAAQAVLAFLQRS